MVDLELRNGLSASCRKEKFMISLLLDHSIHLVGVLTLILVGPGIYNELFKKEERLIEPEQVHEAYFLAQRKKHGHCNDSRQSQQQAEIARR